VGRVIRQGVSRLFLLRGRTMRQLGSRTVGGFVAVLAVLAVSGVWGAQGAIGTITVDAGRYDRLDTPVCVSLDGVAVGPWDGALAVVESRDGRKVSYPAQLEGGSPPRLWFVLAGQTRAGSKRWFELVRTGGGDFPGITVEKGPKYYEVLHRGRKVLRYHHAIMPAPEGQSRLYDRSGFIHPLWSPAGAVLTAIHPPDHIHHMGIWMPWTHTKFEGKRVDFWNLKAGQGTVRFKRFLSTTAGPVYGGFAAEQEHVALQTDAGEKVVLREVWDVRVYNVGGAEEGYWLWDFKSTQRCVAESPLYQEQYRYGGFGFRAAPQWRDENSSYLSSEGKTRENAHATRARWCDVGGKIEQWEGITFCSHPENLEHPEPMRVWPPGMHDVFFNFCPSQARDWEMKPNEDHVFRYRLYVHEGRIEVPVAERIWRDFAAPPKGRIDARGPAGAIMLFDGKDLSRHWTAGEGKKIGWKVADGAATIVPKTGSIWTKRAFGDFRMHIEFKTPLMPAGVKGQGRGNSGVYIQRRYEVQILDSYGQPPRNNEGASIYRFKAPVVNVSRPPGVWQSYDIVFRAARFEGDRKVEDARITVWHNGVLVHDDVKVPNKTGAGRPEGPEPGPILLQDHGNPVSFRNIWIIPQ